MPLSEHEQRLLEQMERQLYAEDPKFASAMNDAHKGSGAGRRMLIGGAGLIVGVAMLVVGVAIGQIILGVVGFLVMLAGTIYAFSSQRRSGPVGVVDASGRTAGKRPGQGGARGRAKRAGGGAAGFMQRLEERWDRRKGGWG